MYDFAELRLQCITPLHIGCGQQDGVVDLPIIREPVTRYPWVPGSSLRGVFRDRLEREDAKLAERIFGRADATSAGCVSMIEGRILLLPVRSENPGPFLWVTCPFILRRWLADRAFFLGEAAPGLSSLDSLPDGKVLCHQEAGQPGGKIHLEEFPFEILRADDGLASLLTRFRPEIDKERVVVVADEAFGHFSLFATHLQQRVQLDSAKTVVNPFLMEALPAESVFYSFVGCVEERRAGDGDRLARKRVWSDLQRHVLGGQDGCFIQLGGMEAIGFGLTRVRCSQISTALVGEAVEA
ncbi:MAG: type III-B CRISPR module RAMP protein Cmr4 [Planctomycetes bacterium]|nr:type III-B CRISPR module RAMP protein Cmr4 [Planctomycetota bacterium]